MLPQLTPAFLHGLGVNTEALPSFSGLSPEAPIANLEKLIPESQLRFDLAQLRLDISIPQVAMQQHARDYVDPEQWDEGVPALLMNYSLNGSRNWQSAQHGMGKSEQSNMFANLLGGVNYQGWRLRSTMTYTYSESRGEVPQAVISAANSPIPIYNTISVRGAPRSWRVKAAAEMTCSTAFPSGASN